MKKLYCFALMMVFISPIFAQKFEIISESENKNISEVLFKDSRDIIIGTIDIVQKNPFNQLPAKVIAVDELGNKEYIVTKNEFLSLFPEQLRAKYAEATIDYEAIDSARLYSIAQVFNTTNRYLVIAYSLVAVSLESEELLAAKCIIHVLDSTMNEIYNSEVVPGINNYAAVTRDGKYLAIQNGTIDEHLTLFPTGIQILDIKVNKVVYDEEAIIYGPDYNEECEMVSFIRILPVGYRYLFLNELNDCLLYYDLTNSNERLLEITEDGLITSTSSEDTYLVKFKDMQIINFN